jgi:hypothetical protein
MSSKIAKGPWGGFKEHVYNKKHRKVCDESRFTDAQKEEWMRAAGKSLVDGGRRARVLALITLDKHWNALRTFVSVTVAENEGNLKTCEILTKERVAEFFSWLQHGKSAKGEKFSPATIKCMKDSLLVLMEAMLLKRSESPNAEETPKQWKRKATRLMNYTREVGKSSADALRSEGNLGPVGTIDHEDPPYSWEELLKNRSRYMQSMKTLREKIQKHKALGENVEFMKLRLAKHQGALLAFDFISHTCERLGTVHGLVFGRNLKFSKHDVSRMVWLKAGPSALLGKNVKQHRTSRAKRGHLRIKKSLPSQWEKRFQKYIKKFLPRLRKWAEEKGCLIDLKPELRQGEGAFLLFPWLTSNSLGKLLCKIGRAVKGEDASSNDVRAACEYQFKDLAAKAGLHMDCVQYFIGKDVKISTKHYAAFTDGRVDALSDGCGFS